MSARSRVSRVVHQRWIALSILALLAALAACGGVAKQDSRRLDGHAGSGDLDSGLDAAEPFDASLAPDAAVEIEAGAPAPLPSTGKTCCDTWTGERSEPWCRGNLCGCDNAHQLIQPIERECVAKPEVCRVDRLGDLEGKACSLGAPVCSFGSGCSQCQCECASAALVWECLCNAC
jgi:hypothetical protein